MTRLSQLFSILAALLIIPSCSNHSKRFDAAFKEQTHELVDKNLRLNLDSAIQEVYNRFNEIKQPQPLDYFNLYAAKSWYLRESNSPELALLYADSMLLSLNTVSDVNDEYIHALKTKSMILKWMKYYDHSLRELNAALVFAEQTNNHCIKGQLYYSMATTYYAKANYEPSIKYYHKTIEALSLCDTTAFNPFVYLTNASFNGLGLCYEQTGYYDSADFYFLKSLAMIDTYGERFEKDAIDHWKHAAKGVTKGNRGFVLAKLGRPYEGKKELKESIEINKGRPSMADDVYLTQIKLAQLCAEIGELQPAKKLLHFLDSTSGKRKSATAQMRLWNLKYNFSLILNDSLNAFRAYQNYVHIKDSVQRAELFQLPFDLSESYAFIAQRQQILKLKDSERQRNITLITLSLLLLLFGWILFLVRKNLTESKRHVASLDKLNREIFKQHDDLDNVMKSLESSNEENKRLMKVLAHDLRSPVSAMISLASLLEESEPISEEQRETAQMIHKLGLDSVKFMEDLLVARDQKIDPPKQELDLLELLEYCATFMRFKAEEKQQKIEVRGVHLPVSVNRDQIWRVVNNILNNSIKFSPNGSTIRLSLEKKDEEALICISDEGIGIPFEIRDKVFEMYSGSGRSGTGGEKTFGLGLPISKQLVEAHQGRIWFESSEGRGTRFYISLPI